MQIDRLCSLAINRSTHYPGVNDPSAYQGGMPISRRFFGTRRSEETGNWVLKAQYSRSRITEM